MTIQSSFSKGVMSSMAKYLPSYIPKPIDIPRDVLNSHCQQNACHGFYKYSVLVGDEMANMRPLLHDLNHGKEWYPNLVDGGISSEKLCMELG